VESITESPLQNFAAPERMDTTGFRGEEITDAVLVKEDEHPN
jgi:hypothetical protein